MALKQKVLGLSIIPPSIERKKILKAGVDAKLPTRLKYSIVVSEGTTANPLFLSTPLIVKLLKAGQEKNRLKVGVLFGEITFILRKEQNRWAYSLDHQPIGWGGYATQIFNHKGIASLIEERVSSHSMQRFGVFPIFDEVIDGSGRARQLVARKMRLAPVDSSGVYYRLNTTNREMRDAIRRVQKAKRKLFRGK